MRAILRLVPLAPCLLFAVHAGAQRQGAHRAPRLWTDEALRTWALPIARVNATPHFYTAAEYYALPVSELRTYPVYVKGKDPAGYRDEILKRGPQPLIEV